MLSQKLNMLILSMFNCFLEQYALNQRLKVVLAFLLVAKIEQQLFNCRFAYIPPKEPSLLEDRVNIKSQNLN